MTKAKSMGGKIGAHKGPGLTKKSTGFGANLGKMSKGKGAEGPKMGHKY